MNALRLLMAQHDRLEGLLVDLREAPAKGDEAFRPALAQFLQEARRHLSLEESFLYPAVVPRLILVEAAPLLEEHEAVRAGLDRLEAAGQGGGDGFAPAWETLHRRLVSHLSDEEIELFPEVRRRFDVDELDELGERMERVLEEEEARAAPPPAEPAPQPEPDQSPHH